MQVKKKKRIKRKKFNYRTNTEEEKSTDMSGNDSDCYETKVKKQEPYIYNDDEGQDAFKVNKGFKLVPLFEEIYGSDRARESKQKFFLN
jgi:hypothetical protein